MTHSPNQSVLAIDVGSTSAKLGWFPAPGDCAEKPAVGGLPIAAPALPAPQSVLRLEHARQPAGAWLAGLDAWLDELPGVADARCVVASVHQSAAAELCDRLARRPWAQLQRLGLRHIPIEARVAELEHIGVDRLLGAVAVNRLRNPHRPAISVDMGTAITVNLISADGAFEGGAILAGPGVALAALHEATASLPLLAPPDLAAEHPPVGKTTEQAMRSGAFWGAVGAIRELTKLMAAGTSQPPEVFLTGGGSQHFAPLLEFGEQRARHVPYLVLTGIRLTAEGLPAP